jgi:cell division transport system permease protein
MRALRYFAGEAAASLKRGRGSSVLAIATIAAALFVLGGLILLLANFERVVARWGSAAEFSVYLRDEATDQQRAEVARILAQSGLVGSQEFVAPEEALRRFITYFPDLAHAAEEFGENALPASFEVRLKAGSVDDEAVDRMGRAVAALPAVADVRYDRQWIDRLTGAVDVARAFGLVLIAVLVVAAALTVSSVVRLALNARQDEVLIMQLVGAPIAYIRGPFVAEGVLQGGAGALLSLGLLYTFYLAVRIRYAASLAAIDMPPMVFLPLGACALLIAGGMIVGCAGGFIAARAVR